MFKHSLFHRLLRNSFFLGCLFSNPGENENDYITSSYTYRLSHRVLEAILNLLYKVGGFLRNITAGSLVGQHLFLMVGILIFLYFCGDIAINDYGWRRSLVELILGITALAIALLKNFPGLGQGSLIISFLSWWGKSD